MFAAEILGKGYMTWRNYIRDHVTLIQRLFNLVCTRRGTSALYQTIKTQTCSESLLTLLSGSVIGAVCMSYLLFCWQTQVRDPPFISRCANHSLMQIGAAQPLEFVIALAEDPVRG